MTPAAPRSKGPLRVRMLSTFYPHLGDHMGFRQVRRHFDPARVEWTEQLVIKPREHLPLWFRAGRRMTRKWFSAPPAQYMLEDWLAERALLRAARSTGWHGVQPPVHPARSAQVRQRTAAIAQVQGK